MIRIRSATFEDRTTIHAVHTTSIRRLCATHYGADKVERWAGFLAPEHYMAVISDVRRRFVVAEADCRIVGFGQLNLEVAEIEAIYVHPDHARVGVGSAIMQYLEQVAVDASMVSLHLTATLNAVPFYQRHGFKITSEVEYDHPSGIVLRCVFMVKNLESTT